MSKSRYTIPPFDKDNYDLWKKKMLLYIRVANTKYMNVLMTGPKIPMDIVEEQTVDGITTPGSSNPNDPTTYTPAEKEDASLDDNLQFILVQSLDVDMHNHVVNCINAKHIWETIETLNEGT